MFKFYFYKFYGLGIKSLVEFPELTQVDTNPDVFIRFNDFKLSNKFLNEEYKNTSNIPFFSCNELIFRVIDGKEILVNPRVAINKNFLRSLILNQGMGTLLYQRNFLVLHGSSVKMNDKAVAFLGQCGDGKSTIIATLNNEGYPIISDDVLAVKLYNDGIPLLLSSYPRIKLYTDVIDYLNKDYKNYEKIHPEFEKYNFKTNSIKLDSNPLDFIYILNKADKNEIQLMSPQEKLISLVKHTYHKSMFGSIEKTQNLKQCINLSKKVVIKQLNVSHSFKEIEQLINVVEDDIFKK